MIEKVGFHKLIKFLKKMVAIKKFAVEMGSYSHENFK